MKVGRETLVLLLETNVIELKFQRRRPKKGGSPTRRMLCTNSPIILESEAGRKTLHYRRGVKPQPWPASPKNLVVTWDILKQDYRCISMDNCEIITQMAVSGDGSDFWKYFNDTIYKMTGGEKETFFNV
tara:strand:- start:89 stop:475 length:387 start_codon:yes stop_codon:yes gene_type:complete